MTNDCLTLGVLSYSRLSEANGWIAGAGVGVLPSGVRRRMAAVARDGVTTALHCLSKAGVTSPEAIYTATAMSALGYAERTVGELLRRGPRQMSPTPFIESTANVVGSHLSLLTGCQGPNVAHTLGPAGLSALLLEAALFVNEEEGASPRRALLVCAEERSPVLDEVSARLATEPPAAGAVALLVGAADEALASTLLTLTGQPAAPQAEPPHHTFDHYPVAEGLRLLEAIEGFSGSADNMEFVTGGSRWSVRCKA